MRRHGLIDVFAVAYERTNEMRVFVQSWINQSADNWRLGGRDLPAYSYFETSYRRNSIDISAAIVKTDRAKKVGFRDKGYAGDASYFEDILLDDQNILVVKLPHILFVHN
jgi:hypothetical protein